MATVTTPGGVELAYAVAGQGPALLLIHGITESRSTWDPLIPALAAGHRVVSVDLPGHGESGAETNYDIRALAGDVAHVVDALSLPAPMVVGHSLGGLVATAYGAAHASRGIVNIDQSLALADFQGALRQLEPVLRGDATSFNATISAVLESMAGRLAGPELARVTALRRPRQEVTLAIWAPVLDSSPAALDELVRAIGRKVRVPYLALHGIDPGEGYAAWLGGVIPGAQVEVWPDVGHYPHLVDPGRFLARLAAFEADLP